jgi:predicted nucleic acid-binding protein
MTTSDQRALIDTNVLVYAADTIAEFHEPSKQLRERGRGGEVSLVVTPQVLMEFFAVVTNPRRVTNPRSPEEAREEIEKYVGAVEMVKIYPHNDIIDRMLTLLRQYPQVTRQEIFDLYLVATMLSNGVTRIYTYNLQHFSRFHGIEALTP